MAMEVVWTRAFTPVLKTQVYSFALIVFTYLGATFFGSWVYRRDLRKHRLNSTGELISALAITAFLPVLANNPQFVVTDWWATSIDAISAIILLASICPFCALLGYLTPSLIDEYAAGHPTDAGQAYAINVLGCILGPLFACYVLLPHLSERYALILLGLPFFVFWFFFCKSQVPMAALGIGTGHRCCSDGITVLRQGFRDHAASHPKKHGRPAGLCRHGHFLWRGARQTPSGQWHWHDHPDTDHQIHGPSADGFSPGPARIRADHLFWHGHKLIVQH